MSRARLGPIALSKGIGPFGRCDAIESTASESCALDDGDDR